MLGREFQSTEVESLGGLPKRSGCQDVLTIRCGGVSLVNQRGEERSLTRDGGVRRRPVFVVNKSIDLPVVRVSGTVVGETRRLTESGNYRNKTLV